MDTGAGDTDPLQNDRTSASGASKYLALTPISRAIAVFGCRKADGRDRLLGVEAV